MEPRVTAGVRENERFARFNAVERVEPFAARAAQIADNLVVYIRGVPVEEGDGDGIGCGVDIRESCDIGDGHGVDGGCVFDYADSLFQSVARFAAFGVNGDRVFPGGKFSEMQPGRDAALGGCGRLGESDSGGILYFSAPVNGSDGCGAEGSCRDGHVVALEIFGEYSEAREHLLSADHGGHSAPGVQILYSFSRSGDCEGGYPPAGDIVGDLH